MLDFLCNYLGGEPTISNESLAVEWQEREEALSRIIRPVIRDRLRDMLKFDGQTVYRAYTFDAGKVLTEHTIHEERRFQQGCLIPLTFAVDSQCSAWCLVHSPALATVRQPFLGFY